MTDTMTSQNIDLSSGDTLYVYRGGFTVIMNKLKFQCPTLARAPFQVSRRSPKKIFTIVPNFVFFFFCQEDPKNCITSNPTKPVSTPVCILCSTIVTYNVYMYYVGISVKLPFRDHKIKIT
jgi:hypothetical protein